MTWRSTSVRQFTGVEVAPLAQGLAGFVLAATVEGVADVGVEMAELAKTQAGVQHTQVEGQGQQQAEVEERRVDQPDQCDGRQHGDTPHDPRMVFTPSIEVASRPACPVDQGFVQRCALWQGAQLFDDQSQQDRKEAHAAMIAGAYTFTAPMPMRRVPSRCRGLNAVV